MNAPAPAPIDPNATSPVHETLKHMNDVLNKGLVRGFIIVADMADNNVMTCVRLDVGVHVTHRHALIGGIDVARHDFIEQRFEHKKFID